MRFSPHRFIMATGLGWVLALPAHAERLWMEEQAAPQTRYCNTIAYAALLLALVALFMLWRQRRLRDQIAGLQGELDDERTLRASAEQALQDTHASLCKLAALQDGIKEQERRRIGRDIHDDLGQNLLALKIDLCMLRENSLGSPWHHKMDLLARNVDLSISSLRQIINDLRPVALEAGLRTALERQLSEFSRLSGIQYELEAEQSAFDAGADMDAVVFRILQESLSNIMRHAKATEVKVALRRDGAGLTMKVSDNGIGMSMGQLRGGGLRGMRERVGNAGGQFIIDSAPEHGTALSLSIPPLA
ncbi:signal transduction histidine kinase [Oxalobacteraceae bacterium GrIS 1.11]